MPQSCLTYNAVEDKAVVSLPPRQVDLDFISLKASVCWAALNNNIILGGKDMGEGYPAESGHHITVKGSVHVHL